MSFSLNRVELIGHLGADPEVRRKQDGEPIATLRVATSETWRDKATGERKERTEWHRVVIFNVGLAKVAEQYLKKALTFSLRGNSRPANGKIKTARTVTRPRSCCRPLSRKWACSTSKGGPPRRKANSYARLV